LINRPIAQASCFQEHREIVLKNLREAGAKGALVLYGLPEPGRPLSDYEPLFRQDSCFYYLTGVNFPNCGLYIDIETGKYTLFYPEIEEEMEIWAGHQPTLSELKNEYKCDDIYFIHQLEEYIKSQKPIAIHTIFETYKLKNCPELPEPQQELFVNCISDARQCKTAPEIELMKYAQMINDKAYRSVLNMLKPGLFEFEVESTLQKVYYGHDCLASPFQITVCSGEQCAILHYHKKTRQIQDGELVLIDSGGEYEFYCADNTRTYPSNGKYSPDQRLIYTAVLNTQKAVINAIKPGIPWPDMAMLSAKTMAEELLKVGLLKNGTADELVEAGIIAVFYPHGLGHGMGLDVHEIGGWTGLEHPKTPHLAPLRLGRILKPGMTVTVEPGCYFIPLLYEAALKDPTKAKYIDEEVCRRMQKSVGGVRIEDDILVTEDGNLNLSIAIPKEIDEVEALMAQAKNN